MENKDVFSKFKEELTSAAQQVENENFDAIDRCIRAVIAVEKKYFYEKENSHGRVNEIKELIVNFKNT